MAISAAASTTADARDAHLVNERPRIATNALEESACEQISTLLDPIVSAGGVFRPLASHEVWQHPKTCAGCLLVLWPERAANGLA